MWNSKKWYYWKGILAEIVVVIILKLSFHKVIKRRYNSPAGEVDIISKRGNKIYFIEVKCRQDIEILHYTVSNYQLSRIMNSSQFFLSRNNRYREYDIEFDIFFIRFPFYVKRIRNVTM